MLISHSHQFIYTKTAKTAGTSVEVYFERYCMPEGEWTFSHPREQYVAPTGIVGYRGPNKGSRKWFNHMPAETIKRHIGDGLWDRYFKFCVVRNPFDQLISWFHFDEYRRRKYVATGERSRDAKQSVSPVITDDWTLRQRFRDWVARNPKSDRHAYMIDDRFCVDYFIRYENLEEGIRKVCETLGISFDPLQIPRLKAGIRPPGRKFVDYYDAATIDVIAKRYDLEMKLFGYEFPECE